MNEGHSFFGKLIGARVKRVEDPRLLTGQGRYVDDLRIANTVEAAFLRSPFAHAVIRSIDTSAARDVPGVIAVYTGADIERHVEQVRVGPPMPGSVQTPYTVLATDRVRLVGDLVAMVVATDRYIAEDALDLIEVDYDPLPAVTDLQDAKDPSSPPLYPDVGSNVVYTASYRNGEVDEAFASADRIVSQTYVQHRVTHVPMETRGCLADYTPSTGELTFHSGNQSGESMRQNIASHLGLDPGKVRVVTPDVGGAFGLKYYTFREDILVAMASKLLGRPVKWIEDRRENLIASGQAREETLRLDLAVNADGEIRGLKVDCTIDIGAYPMPPFSSIVMPGIMQMMLPGPYKLEAYQFDTTAVVTNKGSYLAYRGPWAVETWVRESILDQAAAELGIDPVAIRRRNILHPADQPYQAASGITIDRISADATLERAVELADIDGFRKQQAAARAQGRLLGFGLATFIEAAPGQGPSGNELAHVRMDATGHVTVFTAQTPHGQGHETTLAQVVAGELGVPFEHVKVLWGDTRQSPILLTGTGGSRSATMASGAALFAAREVKDKLLEIASHLLECAPEDLDADEGTIAVKGVPAKTVAVAQIAAMTYQAPDTLPDGAPKGGLEATFAYDGGEGGYAQATHCCWVEIDPETGQITIPRYLVVEDCGTMINPNIVEGQICGGTVQGIGQVLLEEVVYDADGNNLTSTFMDYLVPTMPDLPHIEIDHLETPPISPVNFRGVGEGGAVCAPPAITNAIADALGRPITRTPVTPVRVLEMLGVIA